MKSTITFIALLLSVSLLAQDKSYLHTATPANNNSGYITTLDHPDLNNNPNANIFAIHNYSPGSILHNVPIGTWYDGNNWTVFNEDFTDMIDGVAFNIYIVDGGTVIEHTQDGTSYTTELSHSSIDGNPSAAIISAKYWNPFGVYNLQNYGFWYDDGSQNWNLYAEDLTNQPADAYYKILTAPGTGNAVSYVHTATAGNVSNNWTNLDHPLLNGDPEAQVIVQHNWGTTGDASNITIDKVIGVWYTGTNWAIYIEDQSAMPVDAKFNVYIPGEILSTEDLAISDIFLFPNPTSDKVTINANEEIKSITVYDILGHKIQTTEESNFQTELDVARLPTGQYLLEVQTENSIQTKKLIKN